MSGIYGFVNTGENYKLNVSSLEPQDCMFSDNDITVAMIGEVFEPKSDFTAKTIAELYRKYGENCVEHLEGQFNFCVWDKKEERLILVTDRFGTSPLYYYWEDNKFIFASKIKAILDTKVFKPSIDKNALYSYLSLSFVPTPQTIYNEIKKLPPGHIVILKNSKLNIRKYWDVFYKDGENKGAHYYAEKIRQALEEAVGKRFDAKATNYGAFLSGGLDSSTVSGLMKKISGGEVKTFSAGFEEPGYSELEYVNIAAKHFGLKSYQYVVRPQDLLEAVKILIKEYDEPFGNSSGIAAYYCVKMAKDNNVDTILSGDGGDENFGGYTRYVKDKIYSFYHYCPRVLRKALIEPCVLHAPFKYLPPFRKIGNYIKHANIPNPERFCFYELYPMRERNEIFSEEFLSQIDELAPLKVIENYFKTPQTSAELNRLTYVDTKIGLIDNDLRNKMDKIASIFGVKVRHPMLDTKLWELGAEIPASLKVKGLERKYMFKKAFENFLPREIILKKKHGFGVPYGLWVRTNPAIRKFTQERLLDDKVARRGYFKKGFFENILRMHDEEKSTYYGDMLWVYLMLEIWHNEWVDNK